MHVDGVVLNRATINVESGTAATFHAMHDLEVLHFRTDSANTTEPAIRMNNVRDVLVGSSRATAVRPVFLELSGSTSENVQLSINRIAPGVKEVALVGGATADATRKLT